MIRGSRRLGLHSGFGGSRSAIVKKAWITRHLRYARKIAGHTMRTGGLRRALRSRFKAFERKHPNWRYNVKLGARQLADAFRNADVGAGDWGRGGGGGGGRFGGGGASGRW